MSAEGVLRSIADDLVARNGDLRGHMGAQIEAIALRDAADEIASLRQSLLPFAAIPFEVFNGNRNRPDETPFAQWNDARITLGDLRRVRALLSGEIARSRADVLQELRTFCAGMKSKNDAMKNSAVPEVIRHRCDGYSQAYGSVIHFIDNALSEVE